VAGEGRSSGDVGEVVVAAGEGGGSGWRRRREIYSSTVPFSPLYR